MMNELYILAHIDGCAVAIKCDCVESIIRVAEIVPVPKCRSEVAGLFALRSRVLTLIDAQVLITGKPKENRHNSLVIVTQVEGHSYGLMVDTVEDVVAIDEDMLQNNIDTGSGWNDMVSSVVSLNQHMVMIIEPKKIIGGQQQLAA